MSSRFTKAKSFKEQYQKKRRRGFSLFEFVLVLGLITLTSVVVMTWMQMNAERMRGKSVGDKLQIVTVAARSYVKANGLALQTLAPTNGALVIPVARQSINDAIPTGPSGLKSLQGGGFLPETFIDTNAWGQNTVLLVKKSSVGDGLQAIVTTYGGRPIPDDILGHAANTIGAIAGYVPETYTNSADDGLVVGNYGGWRTPVAQWGPAATRPSAGRLQTTLAFDDTALLADYVYRDDIGIPEANRMNTNLDMNNNDLDNVDQVTAGTTGTVEVVGNMRATIDIYARDAILSRNLDVAGNAEVDQNLVVGQNAAVGNDLGVANNAYVGQDLDVADTATVRNMKAQYLDTNAIVYGAQHSGINQNSDTTTGNVTLGDLLPKSVAQYSYLVTEPTGTDPNSDVVYKPVCKGGTGFSRARVMVYPLTDSWRSTPDVRLQVIYATSTSGQYFVGNVGVQSATNDIASAIVAQTTGTSASTWRIKWIGTPVSPNARRRAIAQTFCYYGE
jgi:type II secretory pathway pseudopilin PulG